MERDPFVADESDLSKTHASESSLWEVASLQQHSLPYVAKAAGFINRNLPLVEYNIGEYVESTYEEVSVIFIVSILYCVDKRGVN